MSFLFPSLRGYERSWLGGDVIAGLTVWAVLVPEALAYATIAGVSPVVGLYAAPGALVLYAALGSSRQLITGPGAAAAALSAAVVGDAIAGSGNEFVATTAALAICVGLVALIAGLLRLGFLANFISEPVLKGFIAGLSLTILVGQVPKLFGIEGGDGDFFEKLWDCVQHLPDTDGLTLLVGASSLALVLGLRRLAPAVPGSLLAVFLGIGAVELFDLRNHGVSIVGSIQSGLPSLGVPDLSLSDYGGLAAGAVGVMLVGFAEALGAAKTYAAKEHQEIDANRELVGLGAANLGAGLSSGMAVNGSLSKTAVNATAGGKTQLAGLIVAAMTVVTLLLLTGLFESLPEATLAAVVIAALIELVDIPGMRELYRTYTDRLGKVYGFAARADFIAAGAAMLGVMVFDTLPGLFIGIGASLLLLIYRASRPHVALLGRLPEPGDHWDDLERHDDATEARGVVVLRPEGELFFANADAVRQEVIACLKPETKAVVVDAAVVSSVDVTGARMLDSLIEELEQRGIRVFVAREIGQVRDFLGKVGGETQVYTSVQEAVDAALKFERAHG